MKKLRFYLGAVVLATALFAACGTEPAEAPNPTVAPTDVPATPTPTPKPTPTKKPTPTPMGQNLPEGINLKNTYGETFGRIGTCINQRHLSDLDAWKVVEGNYNSITMENEMKPDAILGSSPMLLTIDDALAMGYVIPENYEEETVPKLNFNLTDSALKFCAKRNLGLRGHTLVWHSQTPSWFFREGYKSNGAFVSPEVMDARMEFYIRTVMGHVYDNENGHVLYSWDVVNEYLHASGEGWKQVYGEEGLSAGFVKNAFVIADDVLRQYGIREQVTLLYNDYSTYDITTQILRLLEFINADGKVCDGIGMQSHLSDLRTHLGTYVFAVKKFLEAGHEVYITELDIESTNESYQANYFYDFMTKVLEIKKEGGAINGITLWGLSDNNSWKGADKPLLFKTLKTPKASYYRVLGAFVDSGLPWTSNPE